MQTKDPVTLKKLEALGFPRSKPIRFSSSVFAFCQIFEDFVTTIVGFSQGFTSGDLSHEFVQYIVEAVNRLLTETMRLHTGYLTKFKELPLAVQAAINVGVLVEQVWLSSHPQCNAWAARLARNGVKYSPAAAEQILLPARSTVEAHVSLLLDKKIDEILGAYWTADWLPQTPASAPAKFGLAFP